MVSAGAPLVRPYSVPLWGVTGTSHPCCGPDRQLGPTLALMGAGGGTEHRHVDWFMAAVLNCSPPGAGRLKGEGPHSLHSAAQDTGWSPAPLTTRHGVWGADLGRPHSWPCKGCWEERNLGLAAAPMGTAPRPSHCLLQERAPCP